MEPAIDMIPILTSLLQAVPFWAILGVLFHLWQKRVEKKDDLLERRLIRMERLLEEVKEQLIAGDVQETRDIVGLVSQKQAQMETRVDTLWMEFQRKVHLST